MITGLLIIFIFVLGALASLGLLIFIWPILWIFIMVGLALLAPLVLVSIAIGLWQWCYEQLCQHKKKD